MPPINNQTQNSNKPGCPCAQGTPAVKNTNTKIRDSDIFTGSAYAYNNILHTHIWVTTMSSMCICKVHSYHIMLLHPHNYTTSTQSIVAHRLSSISEWDLGAPLHSMVIVGTVHPLDEKMLTLACNAIPPNNA